MFILTKIETDNYNTFEEQYGFTSSVSAQGTKNFLDGIKASISANARETSTSSSKVVESLDVKTTKSILLRRVIEQCASVTLLNDSTEGDLVKVDRVKLERKRKAIECLAQRRGTGENTIESDKVPCTIG